MRGLRGNPAGAGMTDLPAMVMGPEFSKQPPPIPSGSDPDLGTRMRSANAGGAKNPRSVGGKRRCSKGRAGRRPGACVTRVGASLSVLGLPFRSVGP